MADRKKLEEILGILGVVTGLDYPDVVEMRAIIRAHLAATPDPGAGEVVREFGLAFEEEYFLAWKEGSNTFNYSGRIPKQLWEHIHPDLILNRAQQINVHVVELPNGLHLLRRAEEG